MTTKGLQGFADWLVKAIRKELIDQGHYMGPGGLADDIETVINEGITDTTIQVWMRHYAGYLERGVASENIPFSGVTGKGGKSAYIEGLIRFAEKRGMTNPKSAAFAIAHKHKAEGMPTRNSYKYSNTGERKGFISEMEKRNKDKMDEMLSILFQDGIETHMDNVIANSK